ncbi:flavodoxin family protein [Collinsella intestinalis]|uniref:Flavodoxin family protein n=1 Tax=Collinsella intestinalis TaxID=147207 RepID=A0A414FWD0_9ACTN|nr:flavodoxin family protein [Collinsella intestinalis]RHD55675.1 flavodoxin family protein [Collinsella intestinalis]
MKVILVNGSPHKNGCTHRALAEVATTLDAHGIESEIFWIGAKPAAGCMACGRCRETGACIFDDAVNEFRARAEQADGFVFGAPVHYAHAASSLMGFMDRLFYSNGKAGALDVLSFKPAAAIASARRAGTTAALDDMQKFFTISSMPIVSSRYWNMVHGCTPEEVEQDQEGLWTMRQLGRNMAWLLKSLEAGREAGIGLPDREAGSFTSFIR